MTTDCPIHCSSLFQRTQASSRLTPLHLQQNVLMKDRDRSLEGQRAGGQAQCHPNRRAHTRAVGRLCATVKPDACEPRFQSSSPERPPTRKPRTCPLQHILNFNSLLQPPEVMPNLCRLREADSAGEGCFNAVITLRGLSAQIPTEEPNANCCFCNSFIKISTQHHSQL